MIETPSSVTVSGFANVYKLVGVPLDEVQVLVDGLYPEIDGLGLEGLDEVGFVDEKIPLVQFLVLREEIVHGVDVRRDGVLRQIRLTESGFESCFHIHF